MRFLRALLFKLKTICLQRQARDEHTEKLREKTNTFLQARLQKKVPGFTGPFLGPVVCLINRYCDSTCEGIAKGFSELAPERAVVAGFEGTLGSFGMSGGSIVLPVRKIETSRPSFCSFFYCFWFFSRSLLRSEQENNDHLTRQAWDGTEIHKEKTGCRVVVGFGSTIGRYGV